MNRLEIIDICAAGPRERIKILELCSKIRVPRLRVRPANLKVYGSSFSTELSIHIQWKRSNKMYERQRVTATDSDMTSWKKVGFTIKREAAAVPAALIFIIAWVVLMGILARIILYS
jgi:hypothetical protein